MINIHYAQIRTMDISNGEGIGASIFVQGCHFLCFNCFNPETWDFSGGKEWTQKTKEEFLKLIDRPYIKRISLLGGEPLADENISEILELVDIIHTNHPEKKIWCYTGWIWESIFPKVIPYLNLSQNEITRQMIVKQCDVLVDGRYIDELKDMTLRFRGSKNQRIIDVQKSLQTNSIIEWES